ncbi:DUF5050 domain-containing protein [Paenibacillus puldeungensis]|uniref:DUF5050 domain-containing protein n=1 Tax=Paenibacillus puldeungensis TaxID=696536 RepID=A0ABW3S0Q4_9BACL
MIKKLMMLCLVMMLTANTFAFASSTAATDLQRGNTSGNLNNNGVYASTDEWIYYCSFLKEGGIYKVKKDGTEKTKISDGSPWYMNIVGDYLYYSGDGWKLIKQKLDGTDKQVLTNGAFHINVIGDEIYYTHGAGYQDGYIHKMKTDGTGNTKLSNDHVSEMVVLGDSIYYTSFYQKLFKIDLHGKSKTKLLGGKTIYELNVEGEWLYFNYDRMLYKMKTDGTKLTLLSKDDATDINVSEDWIYYSNTSGKKNLVRIKTDGTGREEINQIKSMEISVIDQFVFFYDMSKIVKLDLHE